MDWREASEIVMGLAVGGHVHPSHINPNILCPPYNRAVTMLTEGQDVPSVINLIGVDLINTARMASASVDKSLDWIGFCTKQAGRSQLADLLDGQSKKLRGGEDADIAKIFSAISTIDDYSNRYTTLDLVDPLENPWIETGYEPVDVHVGGIPIGGLIVIGAPPGVGKTYLALKLMVGAVRRIKRRVLFYCLEMLLGQIVTRLIDMSDVTAEERGRILATGEILDIDDVYADASRIISADPEGFYFVVIDFADLLVSGVEDEQTVAKIYRMCAHLAKRTKVPVVLISQLSRNYVGGIPRVHHLRYSGLAEAMSSLIMLLYNPSQLWADTGKDDRLPIIPGRGYVIIGKSRFGFKEGGVGAFQVDWNGASGWGDTSYGWFPLTGGVG